MAYTITERGSKYSSNYRMFFRNGNNPISPLHDIPLYVNEHKQICNMVVEIPRWTNAEMEIAIGEPLNPIRQVTNNGHPKFVPNCFPYHGSLWNYGSLTQTWENPNCIFDSNNSTGDNYPLDVIEIGERVAKLGEVLSVKILGAIAFIEKHILDYKIVAIDVRDPFANILHSLLDVKMRCPMLFKDTIEWFMICGKPHGRPEHQPANGGAGDELSLETTLLVIDKCHNEWANLFSVNSTAGYCLVNTTLAGTMNAMVDRNTAENIIQQAPCYRHPSRIDTWTVNRVHYV